MFLSTQRFELKINLHLIQSNLFEFCICIWTNDFFKQQSIVVWEKSVELNLYITVSFSSRSNIWTQKSFLKSFQRKFPVEARLGIHFKLCLICLYFSLALKVYRQRRPNCFKAFIKAYGLIELKFNWSCQSLSFSSLRQHCCILNFLNLSVSLSFKPNVQITIY